MNFEQLIYISPLILSLVIFFSLFAYLLFKKKSPLLISFMALLVSLSFWAFVSILELSSTVDEMTILWQKIIYFSACSIPILLGFFIFNYLENKKALSKKYVILMSLVPLASLILVLTNNYHYLFFTQESVMILANGLNYAFFTEGLFFWIFVADTYLKIFIILFFLMKKILDKKFMKKKPAVLIFIALIIPFAGNIIFILKPFGLIVEYDMTPFLFAITAMLFAISIFKYKFLNISSIARNEVFDELNEVLIILNENGEIVDFNKKAIELAKKMKINKLKAGMNAKELLKNTKINLESNAEFSLSNGSTLYYDSSVKKMLVNKEPVGIILSIKDITKIKEFEKIKAGIQKDKEIIDLREEFITRISHELRQPLMPIIGYSKELKTMVKSKKANEYIEKIIFNSENLKEMIEKTIKLTEIKTQSKTNMEKKKLSEIIKNTTKDIRIIKKLINDSKVSIDESQILEAINNLIGNALKYSKKEVIIKVDKEGKNAIISIIDKGKGMPNKLLTEINKGTYLAKIDASELRKGFGIGMLISKMIIQAHNGKLEIKSEEGKGTEVKIILPAA